VKEDHGREQGPIDWTLVFFYALVLGACLIVWGFFVWAVIQVAG